MNWSHSANTIRRFVARLREDASASVTTIVALSLPVVIGAVGLAFDLNRGYGQRVMNQRVADMAALTTAMEYQRDDSVDIDAVANVIAMANGLQGATVDAELLADFPNEGESSIQVTVSRDVPFALASVLGFSGSYTVTADSAAIVSAQASYATPCFLALDSGKASLVVNGGASIVAPNCSVAAIGDLDQKGSSIAASDIISGSGDITLNSGSLVANSLRYAGSLNVPQWNNALPGPDDRHNVATGLADPWENNVELLAAIAQIGDADPLPALADPTTPTGSDYTFSWSPSSNASPFRQGTSGNFIVPAGNYTIKKLTVGGGNSLTFASGSTITVSKGVSIGGGSTVNFGDSDVYINGGFDSGSNGVTFGNGVLWIGSGTVSFKGTNKKGDGDVIINGDMSLGGGHYFSAGKGNHSFKSITLGGGGKTLLGDGDLTVLEGIKINGNSELNAGDGEYNIGASKQGYAIKLEGSARLFMGDGAFSAHGDIDTQGGSAIVFGETNNHYITGDLKIAGSAFFGPGRYTIDGDFENGTGGTTWPQTSSLNGEQYGSWGAGYDMAGYDVSFIASGTLKLAGGAKSRLLAAAQSVLGGEIGTMLFHSDTTSKASWTGGSGNIFGGVVHMPNTEVSMTGGNSTSGGGACFMLIAGKIKAAGGAVAGSACVSSDETSSGSGNTTVKLVK
ncbi:TadE/TadG family type IV pilus assembly protein [Croceicoccus sp. Ery15]|uniref:TadE/TadG family type IV pilus assembly protein n=1 Tax=Croceicoccus sp. Ery15 TaxID=1703338 RepID=UPI001E3A6F9F|nr:TadE/TadG family type IV pilus assembly protein [Croceicoccus sp. Ery15]